MPHVVFVVNDQNMFALLHNFACDILKFGRANALLHELHTFVEQDDQRVEITTSIGIYMFDGTESSYDVALHRADNAQYQAKQAGKNCYRFYDDIPDPWLGEMDEPHYVSEDPPAR